MFSADIGDVVRAIEFVGDVNSAELICSPSLSFVFVKFLQRSLSQCLFFSVIMYIRISPTGDRTNSLYLSTT